MIVHLLLFIFQKTKKQKNLMSMFFCSNQRPPGISKIPQQQQSQQQSQQQQQQPQWLNPSSFYPQQIIFRPIFPSLKTAPQVHWHFIPGYTDILSLDTLTSYPLRHWHYIPGYNDIFSLDTLTFYPWIHGHFIPGYTDILSLDTRTFYHWIH